MKAFIIAAPKSGSGKTTVTLGIMAALRARGLRVAPFKVGPDFIDPGYHRLITGRPSVNLDGWICPEEFLRETFSHHCQEADIAVIEGAMGLFDGLGATAAGSTAQVAAILGLPVILVVDGKGQAGSVAPLVQGFARFDSAVNIAGVIFNNVGSDSHGALLREAVARACPEIRVIGAVPRDERLHIPSRHLGLVTAEENGLPASFVAHLQHVVEKHLALDLLGKHVTAEAGIRADEVPPPPTVPPTRIAVARDAAFSFVYDDNLRLLTRFGAELVFFSPLADRQLPEKISGIYLPGGYPELFAPALEANVTMKESIGTAIRRGMPVYAECGGFIYLTEGVTFEGSGDTPGRTHGFVGIFPVTTRMLPKRKALGYRSVELVADSILGPAGTRAQGHEFHYSEMEAMPAIIERLYRVARDGVELGREGFRYGNCLASYVHLHFGSNPAVAEHFVGSCADYRQAQGLPRSAKR